MRCTHCGGYVAEDEIRCPECGTVIAQKDKRKRIRTAGDNEVCSDGLIPSIVLAAISLLCCFNLLASGAGAVAVALSIAARQELNNKDQERGVRIARYARIARIVTMALMALSVLFILLSPWIGGHLGNLIGPAAEWLDRTLSRHIIP